MSGTEHQVSLLLPSVHLHELTIYDAGVPGSTATLEEYLSGEKKLTSEEKTNLLLQVGNCVLRFHQKDIAHGLLSKTKISVLKDFNHDATGRFGCCVERKQGDINSLANVYCRILTNGEVPEYSDEISEEDLDCADPYTALDIIKKMADKEKTPSIEDILQHPFHWSDFQKAHFICKAVDFINDSAASEEQDEEKKQGYKSAGKSVKRDILNKYNMGNMPEVVGKDGWIKKLELQKKEFQKIRERLRKKNRPNPPPIPTDLLCRKACKANQAEKSVFELARFFRNRYVHFREDEQNIKMLFGSYPSGYLSFFTERFPRFFIHVYENLGTYLCTGEALGEFASHETLSQPLRNVQFHVRSGGLSREEENRNPSPQR